MSVKELFSKMNKYYNGLPAPERRESNIYLEHRTIRLLYCDCLQTGALLQTIMYFPWIEVEVIQSDSIRFNREEDAKLCYDNLLLTLESIYKSYPDLNAYK